MAYFQDACFLFRRQAIIDLVEIENPDDQVSNLFYLRFELNQTSIFIELGNILLNKYYLELNRCFQMNWEQSNVM